MGNKKTPKTPLQDLWSFKFRFLRLQRECNYRKDTITAYKLNSKIQLARAGLQDKDNKLFELANIPQTFFIKNPNY